MHVYSIIVSAVMLVGIVNGLLLHQEEREGVPSFPGRQSFRALDDSNVTHLLAQQYCQNCQLSRRELAHQPLIEQQEADKDISEAARTLSGIREKEAQRKRLRESEEKASQSQGDQGSQRAHGYNLRKQGRYGTSTHSGALEAVETLSGKREKGAQWKGLRKSEEQASQGQEDQGSQRAHRYNLRKKGQ
ncbi:hypothetical protein AMATHDRAFT_49922 [Amanita thiersii Skay4041]|uniref:Uncharacterized protein n=1 Tax=Amanita thiersii Skay4041 TaxID=703135 RepID=A0A2A9NJT4_9AGAR|nr:hypothetical protein AMATHDRAFT_49922 [Amanita thiersii Skay4041]